MKTLWRKLRLPDADVIIHISLNSPLPCHIREIRQGDETHYHYVFDGKIEGIFKLLEEAVYIAEIDIKNTIKTVESPKLA